jgi:hypothetical protein
VRIVVTEVTGHGSIRRGVLDTAWYSDAGRCGGLIERAGLDVPPPYRPEAGRPIYPDQCRRQDRLGRWARFGRAVAGAGRHDRPERPARPRPGKAGISPGTHNPFPGSRRRMTPLATGEEPCPKDIPARSPDGPAPGRSGAAMPVPRRGGPETVRAPGDPAPGVRAGQLPDTALLSAAPPGRQWYGPKVHSRAALHVAAACVLAQATRSLIAQERPGHSGAGLVVLAGSVLVLPVPGYLKLRLAKQLRGRAVRGGGALSSAGAALAAVALVGTAMSESVGWWWAGPAAASLIAVFLARRRPAHPQVTSGPAGEPLREPGSAGLLPAGFGQAGVVTVVGGFAFCGHDNPAGLKQPAGGRTGQRDRSGHTANPANDDHSRRGAVRFQDQSGYDATVLPGAHVTHPTGT